MRGIPITYQEDLDKLLTPSHVGLVCMFNPRRIGVRSFVTFLEHRHFPPGTPLNDDFQLIETQWYDMLYYTVVVPATVLPIVDALLKELGLKRTLGIPLLFDQDGEHAFPIDRPNVFTVENSIGHFAYKNIRALEETAYQLEDDACDAVIQGTIKRNKEPR